VIEVRLFGVCAQYTVNIILHSLRCQCYDVIMTYRRRVCVCIQGWIQERGRGARLPIFGKVNFIFYIVYMSEKIFLKLNLDFIVAEI